MVYFLAFWSNPLPAARRNTQHAYWYSISVDSLRALVSFMVLLVLGVLGFIAYRAWERDYVRREAERAIEEASTLIAELGRREGVVPYAQELHTAEQTVQEASAQYEGGEYRQSLASATSALTLLDVVTGALSTGRRAGDAQFLAVGGAVSFRSGEDGDWQAARPRRALAVGDYVRTGENGSAQIVFSNGTLYTVRPNTLFRLSQTRSASGREEQAIRMDYGWVNLATSQRESNVSTPEAEAWVETDSAASVTYDKGARRSQFLSYQGALRVATKGGQERRVGESQQVTQSGVGLSTPESLPAVPLPVTPFDNHQVNLASQRLALAWQPVPGAVRYALQISRSQLFLDNVIDSQNRTRPGATLGLKGEGTFLWRVAAIDGQGAPGPWSEPRRFRVASFTGGGSVDREPPSLALQTPEAYGSIFIFAGSTEPFARVEVNGEPAEAAASDGAFRKTIQLTQEGWNVVTVRAIDASGNFVERRQRVFVEPF